MVMTRSAISVISCIRFVIVELVGDSEVRGESKVEVSDPSPRVKNSSSDGMIGK